MRGIDRLSSVDHSTPAMAEALPDLPMPQTVMIRLIRNCMVGLSQNIEPAFRSIGFTGNSFYVIWLLMASVDGRASPSELSDMLGTSRANMTKIVNALLKDGYVSRSVEERDSRRQVIKVTASGIRAANKGVPVLAETLTRVFSGLTPKEFAQLDALLRKAIASFDRNTFPFRSSALAETET